jgi:hypothetical protein
MGRRLSLKAERKQQISESLTKECYAIRIRVNGTVPVSINGVGDYNPGEEWSESGDHPGDKLVGKVKVESTTGANFDISIERQYELSANEKP